MGNESPSDKGDAFLEAHKSHVERFGPALSAKGMCVSFAYDKDIGGNVVILAAPNSCPAFALAMAMEQLLRQARFWGIEDEVKAHRASIREQQRIMNKENN